MEFKRAQCPSCGGELQVPTDRGTVRCVYCGGEVMVARPVVAAAYAGITVERCLTLATTAKRSGNHLEAYVYYAKALELDPQCPEAWYGKGGAAGASSIPALPRLDEMTACFGTAVEVSAQADRPAMRERVARASYAIACEFHTAARAQLETYVHLDAGWTQYITHSLETIRALEFAATCDEGAAPPVEMIVSICQDLLGGRQYIDPYRHRQFTRQYPPALRPALEQKVRASQSKLGQIAAGMIGR